MGPKRYSVFGIVRGTKCLGEYEAESREDAETQALKKEGIVLLCHHCSKECEGPEIVEVIVEEVNPEIHS